MPAHWTTGRYAYSELASPGTLLNCQAFPPQQVIGIAKQLTIASQLSKNLLDSSMQTEPNDCWIKLGVIGQQDVSDSAADWLDQVHLSIGAAKTTPPLSSLVPEDEQFVSATPIAAGFVPILKNGRFVSEPQLCVSSKALVTAGLLDDVGKQTGWGFIVAADWYRRSDWSGPSATVYYGLPWELIRISNQRNIGPSTVYLPAIHSNRTLQQSSASGRYEPD